MSELIELLSDNQQKLGKILQNTAADLWGSGQNIWNAPKTAGGTQPTTAKTESPVRVKENMPADQLWKVADEVIDWTEVLAHEHSPDGLTSERLWSFYRRNAEKVLKGDMKAYVEVLKTCNPLGDLTTYAQDVQIRTPGPDRLEASFSCLPDTDERKMYGLMLRIARDLFATLPVKEVGVEAFENGKTAAEATYTREQMKKQNFKFLDPVKFGK